MKNLWLEDPRGERRIQAEELPLSVGGPGAAIIVPGCRAGEVRARVELAGGGIAIKPEPGADSGALDGVAITLERRDGRSIIVVRHGGVADLTRPPVSDGAAAGPAEAEADRIAIAVVDYLPRATRLPRIARTARGWQGPALYGAGALLALVLGFLFWVTPVVVATSPDAELDGVDFVGTAFDVGIAGRYLVPPGRYVLAIEADGYAPARSPAEVGRKSGKRFVVALERLPGRVAFDTGGIEATLTVDGVPSGKLPGEVELRAGTRELTINAPHHAEERLRFEVSGGGERQALKVSLKPVFARVSVSSIPAGATVWADDRELGKTPLETELDAGRYALALVHPDFRRFEGPITVVAGQPLTVGPIELGMPDGRLVIASRPAGADVSIGGRYRGRTPVTVTVPPGMPQEVLLTLAGHAPASQTVAVESRAERRLSMDLRAVLGEVRFTGEPADAILFVDGASRGPANQKLSLSTAPHAIEVRKGGLEPFRTTITPQEGQTQLVEYSLKSAGEARVAGLARTRTTSLGQPLVLVTGGRFTMGSPRREPGRRSNEAERQVELKRPFYIARFPVTNREFREFKADHLSGIFKDESLDLERQPVVRVSWQEAAAFCNWLSQRENLPPAYVRNGDHYELAEPMTTGYRLPTEAEWEFAARFDGARATRKYPWGNDLPVPAKAGNWGDATAIYLTPVTITGYDDGFRAAAPVGSFVANPLGLHDMGGNVLEWTLDRYSIYVVGPDYQATDPVGPPSGDNRVIRGASWLTGKVPDLRLAVRDSGSTARPDLGFRIARYAE